MPDLNTMLAAFGYAVLTGVFNAIFAHKSQIDAWAAANPRLAGVLKITRAIGLDPQHLWAAGALIVKGRLPKVQTDPLPEKTDDTVRIIPPLGIFLLLAALVLPTQPSCSSADRSRDIKTAIEGARAACLLYDATKVQLPKPVPEAENLCPVLMARDAVPEPVATSAGGSP